VIKLVDFSAKFRLWVDFVVRLYVNFIKFKFMGDAG
jgi:hypothetical protein